MVEDNLGDARLTREALKNGGLFCCLDHIRDGEQALEYLKHEGRFAGTPPPDLILLDLNLPSKSGFDVLAKSKSDPVLKRIPVIVLTISRAQSDINRAYDLHANCYIVKPINLDSFVNVIGAIQEYWLKVSAIPPRQRELTCGLEP